MDGGAAGLDPEPNPWPPNGSAQDSGVETECDQESNDSSLSSVSVGGAGPGLPAAAGVAGVPPPLPVVDEAMVEPMAGPSHSPILPSLPPTPEPNLPVSSSSSSLMPPPSVTEDGYLGDCSSDGGNEKNFPMPPEKLKRLLFQRHAGSGGDNSGSDSNMPNGVDLVEPPAGLAFQNLSQELHHGYQILNNVRGNGSVLGPSVHHHPQIGSRKMRSMIKNKLSNAANSNNWSHMKAYMAGRKLRTAANVNNVETINQLLASGVDPNAVDDHQRTALHFAAAKGYSDIVNVLLQNGSDPNQKDSLGNTALHLAACTNHIDVVTLLLRAGTNLAELDNNGRTPVQLAQAKLKMLQRNQSSATEMGKIKNEVQQVVEMMREYLSKSGHGTNSAYNDLLNSFSKRFTLHKNQDDINSDLQNLLDSLGNLQV